MNVRALLAVLALGLAGPASASAAPVTISPLPGTPDANPATQISVLGVRPARIVAVGVTGTRTGRHAGGLRSYSGGRGASFLPRTPFAQGERVRVVVRLRGRPAVRSAFTVARLAPLPPVLNLPATQPAKLQSFASEPGLRPPRITVHRGRSPQPIFLTPLPSPVVHPGSTNTITIDPVGPGGPMIIDGHGRLVWFRQLTMPEVASTLAVQRFRGRRVLAWWQGPVTVQAFGLGKGVIADRSYRTVAEVRAGNGYDMDLHEFRLAGGRDALFTIYRPVLIHVPGTPAGQLTSMMSSIVQQVDVATGLVVWEWHALGHVPLSESYATPQNSASYDAYHINSIQPMPGGRLLVSARNTSALYAVDRATGRIAWRLGGKRSDFRLGRGARFWFQHDAQWHRGGRVSLFDDEAGPPQKAPASRGLVLRLDRRRHTATVIRSLERAPDTSAQSEGSTQLLPGGRAFVGFGSTPFFSEFSASGTLLFDAQLPDGDGSYRVLRFPWSARPATRPRAVAQRTDPSHVTVAVSWNGATGVARWEVLAGSERVAAVARAGFETTIPVATSATTFTVRALGARGKMLGASSPVTAP